MTERSAVPDRGRDPELVAASTVADVAFCPRLFVLEHVHGESGESPDIEEGRRVHRRVDRESRDGLPEADDDPDRPVVRRSVSLGDPGLGLVARIDLVELDGDEAIPIDFKKGVAPDVPEEAWEPERVQVCAQALLLRAHGYRVERAMLYYAGSRRRVVVPITDELVARTLELRDEARRLLGGGEIPPPLVASPKCQGCSLVGICLPDETNYLGERVDEVRPLVPVRDDGVPLYVHTQGGRLGLRGGELVARGREGELGRVRLEDTSVVVLMGNVSVSTPLLRELARRDVAVAWHGFGGWYYGSFVPASGHGALHRVAQFRRAFDAEGALRIARGLVRSKIRNQRVLLRRNGRDVPRSVLERLRRLARDAGRATGPDVLMGCEGRAARLYFEHFQAMLRADDAPAFHVEGRNRRPPRDPVNAMLSFGYAMLVREWTHVLARVGLDPYVGYLHQPRVRRPALALDMMEPFRPLVVDSVVLQAVNNRVLRPEDFVVHPTGVNLKKGARRRFIELYERRLDEVATHPVLRERLSMRRMFEVQARLLVRVLHGELDDLPGYVVR